MLLLNIFILKKIKATHTYFVSLWSNIWCSVYILTYPLTQLTYLKYISKKRRKISSTGGYFGFVDDDQQDRGRVIFT